MTDTHKPVLGVDFDDVLFQCDEALLEFHAARYGAPYTREERTTFTLEPVWSCSAEEVQRRIAEFVDTEFHERANPVSGAKEALTTLRHRYDVVIVTGRADDARGATERWLEKNLLGLYREIHFTNHGGAGAPHREKSEILQEFGVDVFVEDNLYFASDVTQAGIPVFLFDTPWNRAETPDGATRVHSWNEVVSQLLPNA